MKVKKKRSPEQTFWKFEVESFRLFYRYRSVLNELLAADPLLLNIDDLVFHLPVAPGQLADSLQSSESSHSSSRSLKTVFKTDEFKDGISVTECVAVARLLWRIWPIIQLRKIQKSNSKTNSSRFGFGVLD